MKPRMLSIILLLFFGGHAMALPIVKVNFVFATNQVEAQKFDNLDQIKKEVDILNRYFVTDKKQPIFKFELDRYISYKQFEKMQCNLRTELEKPKVVDRSDVLQQFQQCFNSEKPVPEIYVFIFDGYNSKLGFKAADSWGFHNSGRPVVLLDWERLNYNVQAALPHEMGHAFGLRHVCIKGAKFKDATNLMASKGGCDGSGGQRNIGFNSHQVKIILKYYANLAQPLQKSK